MASVARFMLACAANLRYLRSLGLRDDEIEHPHGGVMGPLPKPMTVDRWVEIFSSEAEGHRGRPPEEREP